MKDILRALIKNIMDMVALPIILTACLLARLQPRRKKPRIFFGVLANNNMIYIRNELRRREYSAVVIPWIIPNHERGIIDYDLDIAEKFPKLYNAFITHQILIYGFYIWTIFRADILILPFQNRLLDRTGFLRWWEFQLLHLAKRIVIMNPNGADIQDMDVWKNSADESLNLLYSAYSTDIYYKQMNPLAIRRNNRYVQKYADAIILAIDWPDHIDRADYRFHMRCIDIWDKIEPAGETSVLKIVHATNHAHLKGTEFLEEAVNKINRDGKKCDLIILRNTSNRIVLEEIRSADVVFDQILIGAYGRLAIEAMSLGKPVLCHLRKDLKDLYPSWAECPIIETSIHNVEEVIRRLLESPQSDLQEIGNKSRLYAQKYHSPAYVADRLEEVFQQHYLQ